MLYSNLLQADLINLNMKANSKKELFVEIAKDLYEKGYVNKGYLDALTEREENFPTGLETKFLSIALPHADPEFIEKPFVYIVKNNEKLDFLQMGDNKDLLVDSFLFLGINEPDKQVGLLAKLMELFMDESFVSEFISISSSSNMYSLLKDKFEN
ncbi:PTS sugar transporter subunit IIA [Aerococcus viridans]|uniref:PTS sugar transporter subunit IIA n=1 Tax=Aerococcus viridans TaxID=1377 RepID=UPI00223B6BB9|nr:PTS sugar transporter subunit IIA [Aerococcus viridans]MCT1798563.1 PTS sugar transporter subunit IIA [Aerococcus viridans]